MNWSHQKIVDELHLIKSEIGYFPSKNTLLRIGKNSLAWSISKHGGFSHFRKILGDNRKPIGYWKDIDNVELEMRSHFRSMIDSKIMPTARMMYEIAGIPPSVFSRFGIVEISKKLNCRIFNRWKSRDGHLLTSFGEFLLDEYLFSIGAYHEPEFLLSPSYRHRCDQKVGNNFIEIWGCKLGDVSGWSAVYNRKRIIKEMLYTNLGLNLVSIEYSVFLQSPKKVESSLDCLFGELGMNTTKLKPFDIELLVNSCETKIGKHWTFDRVLKELLELVNDGFLPSQAELIEMGKGYLTNAVARFGGMNKFAEFLKCKIKKRPNGYWTVEKIFESIENEMDHFPTCNELILMGKNDLSRAISRNGGFQKLRSTYLTRHVS